MMTQSKSTETLHRPTLALHIRRLRQWHGEQGLTQAELAKRAGVSQRQLSRYETARALPTEFADLAKIAAALAVPLSAILAPQLLAELGAVVAAGCRAAAYPRSA